MKRDDVALKWRVAFLGQQYSNLVNLGSVELDQTSVKRTTAWIHFTNSAREGVGVCAECNRCGALAPECNVSTRGWKKWEGGSYFFLDFFQNLTRKQLLQICDTYFCNIDTTTGHICVEFNNNFIVGFQERFCVSKAFHDNLNRKSSQFEIKRKNSSVIWKEINPNKQERKPHWVLLNHCATT